MDEELPTSGLGSADWLPEEPLDNDKEIGPLTVAAILRGNPQAALRNHIVRLKGTVWGAIASKITGSTNGTSAEKLIGATAGLRLAGETVDKTRRLLLAKIVEQEPRLDAWLANDEQFKRRSAMPRKNIKEVAGMFDDTEWLWDGWIPRGYLSMIVGRPGAGKSYVAAWLASNAILGGKFPDGHDSELDRKTSEIMWIDTEASHALMVQRLKIMGGPLTRFFWPLDPTNPGESFPAVNLAKQKWAEIVADMAYSNKPAWIFVDSLRGSHGSDENSSDMQTVLATSAAIARDVHCGFTYVHHLRKAAPGETPEVTLDMVRGSTAIVAVARVVIAIDAPDPLRPEKRMRVIKSNLAEMPEAIGISIGAGGPLVIGDIPKPPKRFSAVDKAKEFLLVRLRLGPAPQQELIEDAEAQGISTISLRRAQRDLGVVATKTRGINGYWQWALPAHEGQVPF